MRSLMDKPLAYLDTERLEWACLKEYIEECPDSPTANKKMLNQVKSFCDEKVKVISNVIRKQIQKERQDVKRQVDTRCYQTQGSTERGPGSKER